MGDPMSLVVPVWLPALTLGAVIIAIAFTAYICMQEGYRDGFQIGFLEGWYKRGNGWGDGGEGAPLLPIPDSPAALFENEDREGFLDKLNERLERDAFKDENSLTYP